ncbi:MAG: IS1380 family transposase [Armatimonadota bacterium]
MTDTTLSLDFPSVAGHEVVVRFDGGDISSDAGVALVSAADKKAGLTSSLALAFDDKRDQAKVDHSMQLLLRERIYAIALGYEDANDLDRLRLDPALKTACGRLPKTGLDLGSQPTISRLENAAGRRDLIKMGRMIAENVIAQLPEGSKQVMLDVDATEDPCHGQQQLECFNKFYDSHCYLPLLFFVTGDDGRQRLVSALLRPGNAGSAKGLRPVLRMIVRVLRRRLPNTQIILRGDSGFGIANVIRWCHRLDIDYVLALSGNNVLHRLSIPVQMDAAIKYAWEGDGCREFGEFSYAANTWERKERVIVKAEITRRELNPRFVVTSMSNLTPEELYDFYCLRGDRENRIKEFKIDLSSGRTSCHRFYANQFRLLLHTAASVLMSALQASLEGTKWASAQVETLRTRILKVGARVVESCRKIWFHLPTSFPDQNIWSILHQRLT